MKKESVIEIVVSLLKGIEVDVTTMKDIIEKVNLSEQISNSGDNLDYETLKEFTEYIVNNGLDDVDTDDIEYSLSMDSDNTVSLSYVSMNTRYVERKIIGVIDDFLQTKKENLESEEN